MPAQVETKPGQDSGRLDIVESRRPDRTRPSASGRSRHERPTRSALATAINRAEEGVREIQPGVFPRHTGPIRPLSTEDHDAVLKEAIAGGLLAQPDIDLDVDSSSNTNPHRTRNRVAAGGALIGAAAAIVSAGVAAVDHVDHHGHLDISGLSGDLGHDNAVTFAEQLQGHGLSPDMQHQIEAALTTVQIDAGPTSGPDIMPTAHHLLEGLTVQAPDGHTYIVTLDPLSPEYTYQVDGKIVHPTFDHGLALIPADGIDASHAIHVAQASSTDVLTVVTYDPQLNSQEPSTTTSTQVLIGQDTIGAPIIFAPPHEGQTSNQATQALFDGLQFHGGLVFNDKGEFVGVAGFPEQTPYQTGTDASGAPTLVPIVTASLREMIPSPVPES